MKFKNVCPSCGTSLTPFLVRADGWIDAKYKQPELNEFVIVYDKGGTVRIGWMREYMKWSYMDTNGLQDGTDYISYWMPLPQPPTA